MAGTGGKREGAGRKKGVPNKISGRVKQNIVGVFDRIGGREKMAKWAEENQTDFYRLYGRLAPTEIEANVKGKVIVNLNQNGPGNKSTE